METLYKTVPFELSALEDKADGSWTFSGYASTFGNVDQGGDVVMRGAFDASLMTRKHRPLLWQHDLREPIGTEQKLAPDDRGLFGTWKLVDTARGTDAHKLLKAGAIESMSIGYLPVEMEFDDVGIRKLLQVDLLEVSVVSLPMNEQALITQVKRKRSAAELKAAMLDLVALDEDEPLADLLDQIRGFLKTGTDAAAALQSRRADQQRKLSEAHLGAIEALITEAQTSASSLGSVLHTARAEAEANAGDLKHRLELARRLRAYRARSA